MFMGMSEGSCPETNYPTQMSKYSPFFSPMLPTAFIDKTFAKVPWTKVNSLRVQPSLRIL